MGYIFLTMHAGHIKMFVKQRFHCKIQMPFSGVARLHTALDSIRNMPGNTILLDGGDQFQGTLWFNQYKGAAASHFMNRNGYDAMVS